jgi:CubicO group peptidase (beta-lactamase class C family)
MMLNRREFAALIGGAGALAWTGRQSPSIAIAPPSAAVGELPRLMEIAGVPGVAACVLHNGKTVWQHLAGVVEAGTTKAVTPDTLVPAASLGKPVFGHAVLRLIDEGRLDLDRPLKSYVPDHAPADPRGDKITARHVLSHSSGLRNWRNNRDQALVPDFDPGARFQYSGEGFYYLQRAVEKITGMGFEKHMQERLLVPLAMTSSTYGWRADTEARLWVGHQRGVPQRPPSRDFSNRLYQYAQAQGKPLASYTHEDVVAAMEQVKPAPPVLPNFMIPNSAGSLLTTVGDYATFVNRVLMPGTGEVDLRPAALKQMTAPQTKINSALSWGLGWGLESTAGREYLWHWGDNGTYKNFILAHPASRSAVLVFTNGSNGMRIAEHLVIAASGLEHPAFDWL